MIKHLNTTERNMAIFNPLGNLLFLNSKAMLYKDFMNDGRRDLSLFTVEQMMIDNDIALTDTVVWVTNLEMNAMQFENLIGPVSINLNKFPNFGEILEGTEDANGNYLFRFVSKLPF